MSAAVPSSSSSSSSRVAFPVTAGMTGDYRSFDRSTRAGRLLHNLYQSTEKESTLDKELLKKLEVNRKAREAAEQPKVKPVPKSRAYVELPEAPRKEYPKFLPPVGRRPLKQIEQNEREENVRYQQQLIRDMQESAGAKPVRTDEDKFRLQHKFQFGVQPTERLVQAFNAERTRVAGTVAEGTGVTQPYAFSSAVAAREQRQNKERQLWMRRFDEINCEIAERKAHLAQMEDGENGIHLHVHDQQPPHASNSMAAQKIVNAQRERRLRITNELKDLIREMKEIDQKLKEMDDE